MRADDARGLAKATKQLAIKLQALAAELAQVEALAGTRESELRRAAVVEALKHAADELDEVAARVRGRPAAASSPGHLDDAARRALSLARETAEAFAALARNCPRQGES